jgi:hypothetical protein
MVMLWVPGAAEVLVDTLRSSEAVYVVELVEREDVNILKASLVASVFA